MNKFLTILWILILGGVTFISIQLFKPDASDDQIKNNEKIKIPTETEVDVNTSNPNNNKTPKTYTQYLNDGNTSMDEYNYEKAIESYKSATSLTPNSTEPLLKLGQAYLLNNEPNEAEKVYLKAKELSPESIDINVSLAKAYLNSKNIEAAKGTIWQLDKENPQVRYYTGIILILYKDFEGSKKIFQKIIDEANKQPEDQENSMQTNPILVEHSQIFLDAYETFSYYKEGEQIHLQALLAKALTNAEEYGAAIPLLFDIINEKNNYRDAWIVLGYAYLNTNKIMDAIDALTQAKALDEEKPETLFFLGLAYFANNDIDKAIFFLEEADKQGFEPKDQINVKLGDLYLLKEEYRKSANKYEAVLNVNSSNMEVFIRTIWLNIDKLGNPQKALKFAYQALEEHPEDEMSYNLVGWALTAVKNYSEAKKYLTKALEINPNFDAAFLNMGWLYEKQNSSILAKEYYKKAYGLGKGNSIAKLSAVRFNNLIETEVKNSFYQVNISAP